MSDGWWKGMSYPTMVAKNSEMGAGGRTRLSPTGVLEEGLDSKYLVQHGPHQDGVL